MALIDNLFDFGTTAITSSNADTVSANVFDYATARALFGGPASVKIKTKVVLSAGTSPTVRARLVGADAANLATNPVILADTGVQSYKEDGSTALANTDTVEGTLIPAGQIPAKRYYGLIFTLGGTTPSASCTAAVVLDDQTNMRALKQATP